jgi:hypothetical protein
MDMLLYSVKVRRSQFDESLLSDGSVELLKSELPVFDRSEIHDDVQQNSRK